MLKSVLDEGGNLYNTDETGFLIGFLAGRLLITHLNTKVVYLADPDNRESLTAVETVYANSNTVPPILILQHDLLRNARRRP